MEKTLTIEIDPATVLDTLSVIEGELSKAQ